MKKVQSKASFPIEIITFVFLIVLGIISCKKISSEKDISEYYFPLSHEGETIISKYNTIKVGRDTHQMTWHYNLKGADTLMATGYDQNGQILQQRTEQIIPNGIELKALTAFIPDSTGYFHRTEAGIIYDDVFPFEVKQQGGVFLYKIELPDPVQDGVVRTITRNRRYLQDTTVIFQGEVIDGVIFDYKESIEDIREGRLTLDFYGQETYLKGVGLFERIRNYEESLFDIVRLKTISREGAKAQREEE
jgi:hypothetical protein